MKASRIGEIALAATLLTLSACEEPNISRTEDGILFLGSHEASDVVERVIAPGQRSLVLEGFAGSIRLVGNDSDVARLSITRRTRGNTPAEAEALLARLQIEETGDATTFRYKFTTPEEAMSRYDVEGTVPANTPLRIRWVSGNIDLGGLSGAVEVNDRHGAVAYSGPAESVHLVTRNGDVSAVLTSAGARSDVNLVTSNGDVSLSLSPEAPVHLEASTAAGSIGIGTLKFVSESYVPMDAGARFQGRLAEGTGRVVVSTQHGSVGLTEYVPPVPAPAGVPPDSVAARLPLASPDTVIAAPEGVAPAGVPADSLP